MFNKTSLEYSFLHTT